MKLTIIIPIYNEEKTIPELIARLESLSKTLCKSHKLSEKEIEFIFVNDGSTDTSFNLLKDYCLEYIGRKLVNFSRNFGHQYAVSAGINCSSGDHIVIMDGDLQDPPEFIQDLYSKALEGFDVVYARRLRRRGEGWFKLITAKVFYKLLKRMSPINIPEDTGDFRIINRRVADTFKGLKESHRYIRGMISWIGFHQIGIIYERDKRFAGSSNYPLAKMIKFALDGITSFTAFPLKIASHLGMLLALLGFFYGIYVIGLKIFTDQTIVGWASLTVVVLILGGAQLITIGVIGEYIGRIYDESKNRPLYIVEGIYNKGGIS